MSFPPVWAPDSRILILGTYPSPLSRETGFYYGNPRNRFWTLMAEILGSGVPGTIDAKKTLLLKNRVALWDVLESCDIAGASDSSIENPVPNDLGAVLEKCRIEMIYANGAKAAELYQRFQGRGLMMPIRKLPSTSPANARYSYKKLLEEWSCITSHL